MTAVLSMPAMWVGRRVTDCTRGCSHILADHGVAMDYHPESSTKPGSESRASEKRVDRVERDALRRRPVPPERRHRLRRASRQCHREIMKASFALEIEETQASCGQRCAEDAERNRRRGYGDVCNLGEGVFDCSI
eukprot:2554600-Amphidinium_carterae.2